MNKAHPPSRGRPLRLRQRRRGPWEIILILIAFALLAATGILATPAGTPPSAGEAPP